MFQIYFLTNLNKKPIYSLKMGLIKPNNYNQDETKFARIANALSHPARKRIIEIIKTTETIRSTDLTEKLNLNRASVNRHLSSLKQANLIEAIYNIHFENFILKTETFEYFEERLQQLKNLEEK